jgi:hypothetical protein
MPSTTTVADSPDVRRLSARRDRYQAQKIVWRISSLKRAAYCGRFASDNGQGITVKASGSVSEGTRRAGFGGLQTCGSVWACPVCSEKVNAERQTELQAGIDSWMRQGHAVLFGTLTMRHNRGHKLRELLDAISPAWNRTTSGAGVAWNGSKRAGGDIGDRARFGIRGQVRLLEVKHGDTNGWHPHIHFLLFLDTRISQEAMRDLEARMFGRWEAALARSGFSVLRGVGIDLKPVQTADEVAWYFAKGIYGATDSGRAAYEVTGSQSKKLGKGGRSPFEILRDIVERRTETVDTSTGEIVEHDNEADRRLWREWEKASKGRRQLTWSRGLRAMLGLGVEKTDEEIAEEAPGGDVLEHICAVEWRASRLYALRAELLDAAEADDTGEALCALLNRLRQTRTHLPRRRE